MDPSDQSSVAYWEPPDENPNFQSRPPDPGILNFYKTLGEDALYHGPISSAYRISQLGLAKTNGQTNDEDPLSPAFAPTVLDAETANKKYGLKGQLKFDEPISDEAASLMHDRMVSQNDRNYEIGAGSTSGFRNSSGFAMSMAASMLDPVNIASMFIPVLGESRIAEAAKGFSSSTLAQRLAQGSLTGLSAQAVLEPLISGANVQEGEPYTLADAAKNLGYGAAFGGLLHAGIGAIADHLRSLRPAESGQLLETAMNDVLQDRPVQNPSKVAEFNERLNPESTDKITVTEGSETTGQPETIDSLKERSAQVEQQIEQMKSQGLDTSAIEQAHAPVKDLLSKLEEAHGMLNSDSDDVPYDHAPRNEEPETSGQNLDAQLPRDLSGAKPRYGYGSDLFSLNFDNDIDKSLYIVSQKKLSKRDSGYMDFLRQNIGGTDEEIRAKGLEVRAKIKAEAKANPGAGELDLDQLHGIKSESANIIQQSQPDTSNIPTRDPDTGRFLSKEKRLQMLNDQIQSQQVESNRMNKVNQETKENSPSITSNDRGDDVDTPKDTDRINQEVEDLKKQTGLEGDQAKALDDSIKEQVGDQAGREKGMNAAITCIQNHLI